MIASVTAFRTMLYEDVSLPSGLQVRIRALTADDFLGLGELPLPPTPAQAGPVDAAVQSEQTVRRYTHRAIARAVVAPPMTDTLDDGGRPVMLPDVLHVQEVYDAAPADYLALAEAIQRKSGLTQEVRQAVDTFRADPECEVDRGPGGTLPCAPDDALESEPATALSESGDCPDSAG